ncbi:MAG: DUF4012 domain-containing protein [Actinomycetota bacterium]|nr:DUF4012 domain-containing protein [Actinomycetota bacterium]
MKTMKTCTSCGKSKQLDDFPVDKRNRDGHGSRCLACGRRYQKEYRERLDSAEEASDAPVDREPTRERSENDDELIVEPAIAQWRAELEARRRAGIPDQDVDLREPSERAARRRHRFRLKHLVLIVLVLVIALLVDLVYAGIGLRSNLSAAGSSLSQGREAIADSNLQDALRSFTRALNNARDAEELGGHPALRTMRALPWISSDARAASLLTSVAEIAARAGLDITELYDRLGVVSGSDLVGALFAEGQVRLDSVALATHTVSQLITSLARASDLVNEDVEPQLDSLASGLGRVRSEVSEALATLRRAETLLAAAPSLFGENTTSRYLLIIQNPSESRSSGGVIDYYGVLSATDGKLELGEVKPISSLKVAPTEEPWGLVNRSVDFPDVAQEIITRFEDDTGRRMDGVIASDSLVLQYLATVTGPVRARGLDLAIGPDNAAQVLMHDVFEYFEGRTAERHRFVGEIIEKIWSAVTEGIGDPSALLDALNRAAREQHLKVYASEPTSEAAMNDLEISGDPTVFGPRVQTFGQNSLSSSKVDFFLRREIDTNIELDDDGSASVRTTITIENRAPDGPPSEVLGSGSRLGSASLSLQMLLPEGANDVFVHNRPGETDESVGGRPLATTQISIPSGAKSRVTLTYELPPGEQSPFELVLLPAPLAFPDRASVHVLAPEGFCVNTCEDPSPERWDITTTLAEPLTVRASLVSAD